MQTIQLDLSKKEIAPILYAKQADVGRKFKAILTDGGVAYPVPAGAAVSIWYSGSSGEGNYTDIGAESAVSVSGNEIVVEMIAQMLANYGVGTVCIVLHTADGNQLGTWNIPYMVEPLPGMGSAAAKEYFTAFSKAVEGLAYPDASLSAAGKAADAAATGTALAGKTPAGLVESSYNVATEAELDAILLENYNAMSQNTVAFIAVRGTAADVLDGSRTICMLYRTISGYGCAEFVTYGKSNVNVYRKSIYNGVVQPLEYENPPMGVGKEYRTTERYLGKAVYTMTVECENFSAPASLKVFEILTGADKLVSSYATVANESIPTALYGVYNDAGIIDFSAIVDGLGNLKALYATKTRDLTSKYPVVTVKYTKLED